MANKPGIGSDVKCPFFITGHKDRSIICESPVESAERVRLFFYSDSRRASHLLWHCNEIDGGGCPIYAANKAKYERSKAADE